MRSPGAPFLKWSLFFGVLDKATWVNRMWHTSPGHSAGTGGVVGRREVEKQQRGTEGADPCVKRWRRSHGEPGLGF